MSFMSRVRAGFALLNPRDLALSFAACPFCGPAFFVRLNAEESGIRCLRCTASVVHLSIGAALRETLPDLGCFDTCEFSSAGPLVAYLRRASRSLSCSEYFADTPPGATRAGIRCEDIQALTYADASFDLVTHTEVMEHVPDDRRALLELRRVLRPGGSMVFTVPLGEATTVERARLRDGGIELLCEPLYHTDPLQPGTGILAYRDYGLDIADRLRAAGFDEVRIVHPSIEVSWIVARPVVVARAAG